MGILLDEFQIQRPGRVNKMGLMDNGSRTIVLMEFMMRLRINFGKLWMPRVPELNTFARIRETNTFLQCILSSSQSVHYRR